MKFVMLVHSHKQWDTKTAQQKNNSWKNISSIHMKIVIKKCGKTIKKARDYFRAKYSYPYTTSSTYQKSMQA